MTEIMTASHQWANRPADERFTSLTALAAFTRFSRNNSARRVMSNRDLTVVPSATDPYDIGVVGKKGTPASLTHWGFGQLAARANVPAGYLRDNRLPGALIADNLNWGLHHSRDVESVSVLLRRDEQQAVSLAAVNGPDYGVVWNSDIAETMVAEFGDGVSGHWRIPGEFGRRVEPTKANTTLYASDRDMWAFLADEDRRIECPNRRDGSTGSLARGFYVANSEVGSSTLILGMFLFDYVCANRIIWGAEGFKEIRIRHTAGAPHRWIEEIKPILRQYAEAAPGNVENTIKAAQAARIKGDVETFLANRFGKSAVNAIVAAHEREEHKPIATIWDAITGATAYAKALTHTDSRVKIERTAGELLALAA